MRKLLLVAVVALAFTVMVGCGGKKASGLDYIPKSAAVVGEIDVVKVLSIQKVKEGIIEGEGKNPNGVELKKLGLSADKVTKVTFGVDPSKAVEGGEPDGIVIIQLSAPVTDQKKAVEIMEKDIKDPAKVQFLSDTLLAIGTKSFVDAAAQLKGGTGESVKNNAELMAASKKGPQTGLIWLAVQLPEATKAKLAAMAGENKAKAEAFVNGFLGINYSDAAGLSANVTALFNSEAVVKELNEMLTKAKGMAMMIGLTEDAIKVEQKGMELVVSVAIAKAKLDELLDQAKAGMGLGGGAPKPMPMEHPADHPMPPQ